MDNKKKIIILSVILSIFLIAIIVIAIFHTRQKVDEIEPTSEHNYATNDVKDREDETEPEESTEVSEKNLSIDGVEITHLERLTHEQSTDRQTMLTRLKNRTAVDEEEHGKIISEEILDSSTEYKVYIEVLFEDNKKIEYVCFYDPTSLHSFLRCGSVEDYERMESYNYGTDLE